MTYAHPLAYFKSSLGDLQSIMQCQCYETVDVRLCLGTYEKESVHVFRTDVQFLPTRLMVVWLSSRESPLH